MVLSDNSHLITVAKDQFSQSIARQKIKVALANHNANMINLTI